MHRKTCSIRFRYPAKFEFVSADNFSDLQYRSFVLACMTSNIHEPSQKSWGLLETFVNFDLFNSRNDYLNTTRMNETNSPWWPVCDLDPLEAWLEVSFDLSSCLLSSSLVARGAIAGRFRVIPRFLAAAITASRSYTQI